MRHHFRHHHPQEDAPRYRRVAFIGTTVFVVVVSALFLLGLVAVITSIMDVPRAEMHRGRFPLVMCIIPLVFILAISMIGRGVFRRFAKPLADIMAAADDVACGDLSVRVRDDRHGPMRNLARRFNHMTEELERAETQRRNMTADVAHELRNPLHIIQGNLEGMIDGVYEPNQENLSATLDETHLLARLVADLQTLTLAEAGQLPLHPTRFPAGDLVSDVAASFSNQAEVRGIRLQVQMAEDARVHEMEADFDRLDQVLSNLVANALRFTLDGGVVTLSAACTAEGLRLQVSDNGVGIPVEDMPFVFDRFWKGDRTRKRGEGAGSGLGLAISRQIVRMHGGTIRAESQPGQGSTFIIDLPRQIS